MMRSVQSWKVEGWGFWKMGAYAVLDVLEFIERFGAESKENAVAVIRTGSDKGMNEVLAAEKRERDGQRWAMLQE